jgi:hypothetical protein
MGSNQGLIKTWLRSRAVSRKNGTWFAGACFNSLQEGPRGCAAAGPAVVGPDERPPPQKRAAATLCERVVLGMEGRGEGRCSPRAVPPPPLQPPIARKAAAHVAAPAQCRAQSAGNRNETRAPRSQNKARNQCLGFIPGACARTAAVGVGAGAGVGRPSYGPSCRALDLSGGHARALLRATPARAPGAGISAALQGRSGRRRELGRAWRAPRRFGRSLLHAEAGGWVHRRRAGGWEAARECAARTKERAGRESC